MQSKLIETDSSLLGSVLQHDYFIVNPAAPRVINIDVLSTLIFNATGMLNALVSDHQKNDRFTIKHPCIIGSIHGADVLLNNAVQVVAHAKKDHPIINNLMKAVSILMMIEDDGEKFGDGFTNDYMISKALEGAIDCIVIAEKDIKELPPILTNH